MHPTRLIALAAGLSLSAPALAGGVASNFKKENRKGANYWNAQSALDGNLETCWMVPGDSKNTGEYIILDVPKSTVDKIGMVVGWARDEDTFKDYHRIKKVRIEVMNEADTPGEYTPAGSAEVEFEDKMEMQVIDFEDIQVGGELFGGKVKVTVMEIYQGVDYPNFGMSELVLHLGEFDAAPVFISDSGDDPKHMAMDLADDDKRTFWTSNAAEGAEIQFKAEGFGLSRVGLQGVSTAYARPKDVEITANGRSHKVTLADNYKVPQWVEIPPITGYTGSAWGEITLKILTVYEGTSNPTVLGLSELDVKATTYEGL